MKTVDLVAELRQLIGDPRRVTAGRTARQQHGRDLTYHPPRLPDVVVYPLDKHEVSRILRFAHEHGIPVVPFGAGSSLEGHVIPVRGGISLDLTRMDEILEVRVEDMVARVQPGVTRTRLNQRLRREGLFFPVDPGADATIGGMAATNASGTNAVRYGAMKHQVLGLEVVLADGTIVRTGGSARRSAAGYDLTALFVGSEGTLGVFTEITLRLYPLPEHVAAGRAVFPGLEEAARAAVELIRSGVAVARLELVDERTLRAVNAYKGTAFPERPTLFIELAGTEAAVAGDLERARAVAGAAGCLELAFEQDEQARERLWEARHHAGLAVTAVAPGRKKMSTDVCVPLSVLPEAIRHARATIDAAGFEAGIVAHAGDGNFHVLFTVDPEDPQEVERARRASEAIVRYALARGGTCTGEHGVGLGKRDFLVAEHGAAVEWMRAVKRVLDPRGILNPGKVLPELSEEKA
ncbi:MAG TPA: FAD-linked oxidase C-terminal domain-containing protein [Thermaerobacter sp.]